MIAPLGSGKASQYIPLLPNTPFLSNKQRIIATRSVSQKAKDILKTFGAYLVLNTGTFLMLKLVMQYSALDDHVGFLQEKQAYLHLKVWKAAFYTHVFSSVLTLLAGFTQFSTEMLRKHRRVHLTT